MAMIEYFEPSLGTIFAGIGSLVIASTLSYIFYKIYIKISQWFDVIINREAKYEILEESILDGIAQEKGIDLNKELIKRQMLKDVSKKSFRNKIEEKIYDDMFGKD